MGYETDVISPINIDVEGPLEEFTTASYEIVDHAPPYFSFTPTTSIAFSLLPPNPANPKPYLRRLTAPPGGSFNLGLAMNISRLDYPTTQPSDGAFVDIALFTKNSNVISYYTAQTALEGLVLLVKTYWFSSGTQHRYLHLRNWEQTDPAKRSVEWTDFPLNTDLYINMYRDLTSSPPLDWVKVYSAEDMNPGSLLHSMSIEVPNTANYLYFLPISSRGSSQSNIYASGIVWNYYF